MIDLSVSPFMNKVAFITGAASGLGFVTAREFARAGCSIALVDLNEDAVVAAAKSLSDEGFNIIGITCDVADEKQVESAVNKTD
ncbi:SDR family NAD(P)-dependent oxidoreductase [Pectobacterium versatile]|uniref:SDR family NAD(P)-dependent oxidoreductase n=1 Tax=Pectobacterium versatile TaxID=2488639 RepID=UPI00102EDDF6|nr:SDR family NAD(P)-dependent oxidoreductase [Pectobacterium versatile]MBN3195665.1 SDR family NAD(P)-dependent oxidoreductase [Pectobacterium versatile]TAI98027.1 SDR family NAD(P)-dependent oxidoreductase [Pectobacterium versatile]